MFDKITSIVMIVLIAYVAFLLKEGQPPKTAKGAPKRITVETPSWREIGSLNTDKIVVVVSDYECPFCSEFLGSEFYGAVQKATKDGKIRYAISDFPLSFHQHAKRAAEVSRCAAEQGKLWDMDATLHANFNTLSIDTMDMSMSALKLDMPKARECVKAEKYAAEIDSESAMWKKLGVAGTPTVLLGKYNGQKVSGLLIEGTPSVNDLNNWMKGN